MFLAISVSGILDCYCFHHKGWNSCASATN